MRTPLASKRPKRTAIGQIYTFPAPVGGWNARDSLADMPITDAVSMTNMVPLTTEVQMRYGYTQWSTGIGGQVESMFVYAGSTTNKLFAVANNSFYDITAGGAVGAAAVTGLANSRWQYCNVATAAGNYMYVTNGVDTPYLYDNATFQSVTAISAPFAITAVTTTKLDCPVVHKSRVWFIETGSLRAWYLPTNAVGGAAASIDMSAVAQMGGSLAAICTWTLDAGAGVDDYWVAVTSKGEVIVYQGTDPSGASTWSLKGVWRLGSPIGGARAMMKYAGDVLIITQDGLLPLAEALQSSRVNPRVALTDKIQQSISGAVSSYGSSFGWDMIYCPKLNLLFMNVPVSVGSQQQYVMNTITKAWCNFTGWNANCFEIYNDDPYFGGLGYVAKAWNTNADNGTAISTQVLQAFSGGSNPGQKKRFLQLRPILRSSGVPSVSGGINIDFDTTTNPTVLSFSGTASSLWDTAVWDTSTWGADFNIIESWQGANGVGYYGAVQLRMTSAYYDTRWVNTTVIAETGGAL